VDAGWDGEAGEEGAAFRCVDAGWDGHAGEEVCDAFLAGWFGVGFRFGWEIRLGLRMGFVWQL
jgi:hypothetical protein